MRLFLPLVAFASLLAGCEPPAPSPVHDAVEQIKRDEGFRAHIYHDTKGDLTIGYGLALGSGITRLEAEAMTAARVETQYRAITSYRPFVQDLPHDVQVVLLDMAYELGTEGLLGFNDMFDALKLHHYRAAADAALDSVWARVDAPNRAERLAAIIRQQEDSPNENNVT